MITYDNWAQHFLSSVKFEQSYHTSDELAFLDALFANNRAAFENTAAIILEDRRVYDRGVDVQVIREHCRMLIEREHLACAVEPIA